MGLDACLAVINANFELILLVSGLVATFLLWLFTVLAFLGVAIFLGVYLLLLSIATTAIEFSLFVERIMVCAEGSIPHKVLKAFLWLDNWKRSVFYLVNSIILVFLVSTYLLSIIIVLDLLFMAFLYLYKWHKLRNEPDPSANQNEGTAKPANVPPA